MAYTSVIPVRRLDRAVKYVMNKEKTTAVSLQDALDYAANRDKTEQSCLESSYACTLETAFADMRQTKERWHKSGGVQGRGWISLPKIRERRYSSRDNPLVLTCSQSWRYSRSFRRNGMT